MELTIDQALQQGVAAHNGGKLQEAERLYHATLQAQPAHPDANHNLGVIAVSVNKAGAALPLFKTALEANPKVEQFWLSYMDALIKENQLETVKKVLAEGRKMGLGGEKVDALEGQLSASVVNLENIESNSDELTPAIKLREAGKYQEAQEWLQKFTESQSNHAEAFSLLCHVLLLHKKDVEAERALLTATSINSELASIYRNQARLLLKQSKPEDALKKAQIGYERSVNDPESWLVLAACLNANQRSQEALDLTEKILQSNPNYAEAHATRALIRLHSNDIIGAIADADRAVLLKPHLTQIWVLLGSMHHKNKNLAEAIKAMEKAHELEPTDANYMSNLGEFFRQDSRISEAISILEKATKLAPKNISVLINLGTAFQQNEDIDKAKAAYEKALAINPKSAEISNNLGAIAKDAGDLVSALQYFENALEVKPDVAEAHINLGYTLKELGRIEEAEASYRQAIALKPDDAEAHSNLGITLKELGRLEESEASYRQAIALKSNYVDAHNNLGITLRDLGRLEEAEASLRQAIGFKPDFALAHSNLGRVLYQLGYKDSALESIENANDIDPESKEYKLILSVIKSRKSREESGVAISDMSDTDALTGLASSPLILNRVVEPELITNLYGMNSRELDKTTDARYGSGKCSPDFNLFQDSRSIIQKLAEDLTRIMMEAVKSDVYIYDSFFNILNAGGGSTPHKHIHELDKDIGLNLGKQKYSLVYYLSVGDQNCSEPGMLKLYEPVEDILTGEGMITIIPASRMHSAVYGGKTDRVMIGVNFYSL